MRAAAFALYLLFMCSWFLHLPARVPALGAVRIDLVLVCVIMLLVAISPSEAAPTSEQERTRKVLTILAVYAVLTVPLVEWPGSVLRNGLPQFLKAMVFFAFTVALITTPKKLRWLLIVFLACQTFRVLEPLYLNITTGYWGETASMADWESLDRLSGAPYDVVNPNGLAFIVVTIIPFLHYLTAGRVAGRLLYIGLLPALLYTLILTGSRSGMVGLGAIACLMWLKSKHKIVLTAAMAILVMAALPRMSADMADRYLSIFSSNTKNAATAEGRFEGMERDFHVAMRRPFFGHGLGTSREVNANFGTRDQPSHNIYTEILEELGFFGLGIFLWFIASLLLSLRDAARILRAKRDALPALHALTPALQVWIGMNILFSFASYGLSGYEWYFTAGLAAIVVRLASPVAVPAGNAGAPASGTDGVRVSKWATA